VDGVAVTKHATRQTLVSENYGGHFAVGTHETDTGCANPLLNGTFENAGVVNTSQNGAAFTMTTFPANGGATCAFTGTLSQSGQMGDVQGTYFCTNGSAGSVRIFEFQVTSFSVSGRYTASGTVPLGCQASGWFAGLKVTTF